jgi:serine protease Do
MHLAMSPMFRTACRSPLVAAALTLAAGVAPRTLSAQREQVTARRAGTELPVAQLQRLQATVDSLVRLFEGAELSPGERLRIGREIDAMVSQLEGRRMRAAREAYGNLLPRDDHELEPLFPRPVVARGWIGIVVSGAPTVLRLERDETMLRYLTYPEIVSVDPSSPAQRAGLAPGDTLLAYDGRDVRAAEISMTRLLRPRATVRVRVRRDGRVRELPVVVAEAPTRIRLRRSDELRDAQEPWSLRDGPVVAPFPDAPPMPRGPMAPPARVGGAPMPVMAPLPPAFELANGIAGAQLVTVSEGLGRTLGLRSGVLVTSVPVGSPAGESGLREGDVIVRAGSQAVRSVLQLRQLVARAADEGARGVPLDVIREKQRRTITLRW